MAKKARVALTKMKGVESVVDTTARCYIKMEGNKAPTVEEINKHLPGRLSAKAVTKKSVAKTAEIITVLVKGLG